MADAQDDTSPEDEAFIRGSSQARPDTSGPAKPIAEPKSVVGGTPEMAFLLGATTPRTVRPKPRPVPTPALPAEPRDVKQWKCSKCGHEMAGDIAVPVCPMCNGTRDLKERP